MQDDGRTAYDLDDAAMAGWTLHSQPWKKGLPTDQLTLAMTYRVARAIEKQTEVLQKALIDAQARTDGLRLEVTLLRDENVRLRSNATRLRKLLKAARNA